jgi:hypothetical protein
MCSISAWRERAMKRWRCVVAQGVARLRSKEAAQPAGVATGAPGIMLRDEGQPGITLADDGLPGIDPGP